MNALRILSLSALLLLLRATAALACPSCYGAQDSPMTAGMNTAILVMLGIIGGVLASFVTFFLYLWRRNRRRPAALSGRAYGSNDGILITNHEKGIAEWNSI
jgi:heme/copper-type cytochrome/quinol oxidase subunit 2